MIVYPLCMSFEKSHYAPFKYWPRITNNIAAIATQLIHLAPAQLSSDRWWWHGCRVCMPQHFSEIFRNQWNDLKLTAVFDYSRYKLLSSLCPASWLQVKWVKTYRLEFSYCRLYVLFFFESLLLTNAVVWRREMWEMPRKRRKPKWTSRLHHKREKFFGSSIQFHFYSFKVNLHYIMWLLANKNTYL